MRVTKIFLSLIIILNILNIFTVKALNYSMGKVSLGNENNKEVKEVSSYTVNIIPVKKKTFAKVDNTENIGDISTTSEQISVATETSVTGAPIAQEYDYATDLGKSTSFDFFGISAWFWLIVSVLGILIILILYIQSL